MIYLLHVDIDNFFFLKGYIKKKMYYVMTAPLVRQRQDRRMKRVLLSQLKNEELLIL